MLYIYPLKLFLTYGCQATSNPWIYSIDLILYRLCNAAPSLEAVCASFSPDRLNSMSLMMKAQHTAALPQLDYFPGLPYIIQNPPFCVISCQIFAEQSSQGGSNLLPQNIQFVI